MPYGNKLPVYAGLSGLSNLFALPRPRGPGYEILALQAMDKVYATLSLALQAMDKVYATLSLALQTMDKVS